MIVSLIQIYIVDVCTCTQAWVATLDRASLYLHKTTRSMNNEDKNDRIFYLSKLGQLLALVKLLAIQLDESASGRSVVQLESTVRAASCPGSALQAMSL